MDFEIKGRLYLLELVEQPFQHIRFKAKSARQFEPVCVYVDGIAVRFVSAKFSAIQLRSSLDGKTWLMVYIADVPTTKIDETSQHYIRFHTDWSLAYVVDVLERAMRHIEHYLDPTE